MKLQEIEAIKIMDFRKRGYLTLQEYVFCRYCCGYLKYQTKAVIKAGYTTNYNSAKVIGNRLAKSLKPILKLLTLQGMVSYNYKEYAKTVKNPIHRDVFMKLYFEDLKDPFTVFLEPFHDDFIPIGKIKKPYRKKRTTKKLPSYKPRNLKDF